MLNVRELNALNSEEFTRLIGPVFEHSPWIAEKTWSHQPFANRDHLHQALCQTVIAGDDQSQLELIRAHPDLAGRVQLTDASSGEQASANLTQLSQEELDSIQKYNRLYREKFGFPFVICARLNKKEAILAAFPVRLQNSPEQEKKTALDEIFKIADLRLRDIVQ
jgi:2-oxo-4-hydroxy-4-carboxy-5-ureidoimidazoline decarboxylase